MRTRILRSWISALAIAFSLCLLSSAALAQAATESALTHALSSGVGTSLGNAMGKATNQMAGRVAQQTSRIPAKPAVTNGVRHPGAAAVPVTAAQTQTGAPSNGSMIVSIQGGVRQQPACVASANDATAATGSSNAASSSTSTTSVQGGDCNNSADPSSFAHPSEITLPPPK